MAVAVGLVLIEEKFLQAQNYKGATPFTANRIFRDRRRSRRALLP